MTLFANVRMLHVPLLLLLASCGSKPAVTGNASAAAERANGPRSVVKTDSGFALKMKKIEALPFSAEQLQAIKFVMLGAKGEVVLGTDSGLSWQFDPGTKSLSGPLAHPLNFKLSTAAKTYFIADREYWKVEGATLTRGSWDDGVSGLRQATTDIAALQKGDQSKEGAPSVVGIGAGDVIVAQGQKISVVSRTEAGLQARSVVLPPEFFKEGKEIIGAGVLQSKGFWVANSHTLYRLLPSSYPGLLSWTSHSLGVEGLPETKAKRLVPIVSASASNNLTVHAAVITDDGVYTSFDNFDKLPGSNPDDGMVAGGGGSAPATADTLWADSIKPLFQKYCTECHSGSYGSSRDSLVGGRDSVLSRMTRSASQPGAMPQYGAAQPTAGEKTRMIEWLKAAK